VVAAWDHVAAGGTRGADAAAEVEVQGPATFSADMPAAAAPAAASDGGGASPSANVTLAGVSLATGDAAAVSVTVAVTCTLPGDDTVTFPTVTANMTFAFTPSRPLPST
jgi:hypothetical protein